jgi:predicted nuclease of predicted toxin-antitoxin system
VKVLFDQNLSPRLARRLADLFPGSAHVIDAGLDAAGDSAVRTYAASHTFTVVTKDSDFADFAVIRGAPPKVIWIRRGNCRTSEIEALLRRAYDAISRFELVTSIPVLELL